MGWDGKVGFDGGSRPVPFLSFPFFVFPSHLFDQPPSDLSVRLDRFAGIVHAPPVSVVLFALSSL